MKIIKYNNAVKTYTSPLFRFIYKSLRDEAASKDIVQDAFVKLWENINTVDSEKYKSWLFSTSYNLMINYLKRNNKYIAMDVADFKEPTTQQDEYLKDTIEMSLAKLPSIQKSIVLLRDQEGYNYDEIGEMLNLNPSQVKVYLFRARQTVKNAVKEIY